MNNHKKRIKQKTPLVFVFLFIGVVVLLTLYSKTMTKRAPDQRQPTHLTPEKGITLSLSPAMETISMGKTSTIAISATGDQEIRAVDLGLRYDAASLTIVDIAPGTYFTNPMIFYSNIDPAHGTILYSLGATTTDNSTGSLVILTVKAKGNSGSSFIDIDNKTLVSLKDAKKGSVFVENRGIYHIQ